MIKLFNKLKFNKNIEDKYIEIFESKYGYGDLTVYAKKTNIENLPYSYGLSIEGYMFYNTLEDGIEYYNKLLSEFEHFMINNIDITDEDIEISKNAQYGSYIRFYSVDIKHCENGWSIYAEPPTFYSLNDLYLWFKGMVNQINKLIK